MPERQSLSSLNARGDSLPFLVIALKALFYLWMKERIVLAIK
jgi:hypothetical protein